MALNDFLTNIANAIREKKGTTEKINAQNFANEILSIEGGGGGECTKTHVVKSTNFPVGSVKDDIVYNATETDIEVVIVINGKKFTLPFSIYSSFGVFPLNIVYYKVSDLPTSPNITDLSTIKDIYVYIYSDVPYIYCNLGAGNSWIKISELVTQSTGIEFQDKGWKTTLLYTNEDGVYIWHHTSYGFYGIKRVGHEFYEYENYQAARLFYYHTGETEAEEGFGLSDYFIYENASSAYIGGDPIRRRYKIVETEESIKTKVYNVPYIIRSTNKIIVFTSENSMSIGTINVVNDVSEITSGGYYMIYKDPGVWVNVADGTWLYD